jgi:retron-type reverse transcriptase
VTAAAPGSVSAAAITADLHSQAGWTTAQLAVAALEDKIVQRATPAVLNAIYEEDFLGLSYGFRPGRSAHDAMDALVVRIESRRVNFILDADIRSFFDTVDQEWLIRFVEHRVGDRRIPACHYVAANHAANLDRSSMAKTLRQP